MSDIPGCEAAPELGPGVSPESPVPAGSEEGIWHGPEVSSQPLRSWGEVVIVHLDLRRGEIEGGHG